MKTSLFAVAFALAASVAAPALAQEAPPAVERTDDVSQINGQLVKVGEHNEYHYDFRRWNVSTNPIGWMLGFYGMSLSYAPHQNFALRADVNYYRPAGAHMEGYELGVGMPIYFRRTYQGAFLEPGIIVRHTQNTYDQDYGFDGYDYDDNGSTTFGPQVLVGWHWSWDSGLNVAVALGAGRNWSTEDNHGQDEPFINGYLRFGYSF